MLDAKRQNLGRESRARAGKPPEYAADLSEFIRAYKEAIFFTEDDGLREATEFSRDAEGTIYAECDLFLSVHHAQFKRLGFPMDRAGHDFWLSRNSHGAGYFDRTEYGSRYDLNRLQQSARNCGEREAYLGDDGLVHYS